MRSAIKQHGEKHLYWVAILLLVGMGSVFGANLKILPGHVPPIVSRLTPIGRLAATNELRLAIGLPLRDPAGLDDFLAELYNPASPNFRQYLTPVAAAARFGPTAGDYAAVENFARSNGLAVSATYDNRLVLDVTGPAAAVEKAFHITLRTYRHPTEARNFYAPDTEPTVAAEAPMADIEGLSDYSRPHPRLHRVDAARARAAPKSGSAPDGSGEFFGNDFRNAYAPGTTLTGAGQTLGLFEVDGYYASDIAAYASAAGNGRTNIVLQTVLLDGFDGTPTTGPGSGNPEVSIDIELAMAMAPGLARIVVYEGDPNDYIPNDILNAMLAASNTVKNLSCSWGWGDGPSATTDAIFKNMSAVGQSFFNASGDSDAFTAGANSTNGVDNPSLQNAPSSSPYITQVGGTTLTMNGPAGTYSAETAWNWNYDSSARSYVGTSGGVSSYYVIPTWQTNLNLTAQGGSARFRNIPDVALTADNVYVACGNGETEDYGGTSCAAPLWAGFVALANQQAAAIGRPAVGFINPAIYVLAAGANYTNYFHDVVTGSNTWSSSPNLFYATSGYDLCTGLGTPAGQNLINALAGGADALGISPLSGAGAGMVGGPFTITSGNFLLTNSSSSSLSWSLINTSAWLTVSATGGILVARGHTNLTCRLTATASNLVAGAYTAGLTFSNGTSHVVQPMSFTLQVQSMVVNGLFESGNLSGWALTGSSQYNGVTSESTFVHSGTYGMELGQSGSLGYLSQSLATSPGQDYLLSLWLINPDNSVGATPNQFVVLWNGTTLYNQSNLPFGPWTNLQFIVTATSAATMLEFGFEDTPYFLGLDDISVFPVTPPSFKTALRTPTGFNLTWSTLAGQLYQVQYTTNLLRPTWINLGSALTAVAGTLTLLDTNPLTASPARFYRIVQQQQ